MGLEREEPCAVPDTFGLVEYYVTDIRTEVDGSNVRMFCGVKRGGVVHWLYTTVMPAELLLRGSRQCAEAAKEAFNLTEMAGRFLAH